MAQGACLSPPAFVRFREETFKMTIAADAAKTDRPVSSRDFSPSGFDTMCLHAGYDPHGDETTYGLGQGAPRGVPLHRTAPYQVRSASSPPRNSTTEIRDCETSDRPSPLSSPRFALTAVLPSTVDAISATVQEHRARR